MMIESFFYFFVFFFGLIIGSFLNCLIYRLSLPNFSFKTLGGLKGRSFCPSCQHNLGFWDLVPVLSFVFLKARCRYCQHKISWQYPLVEILTGIVFLAVYSQFYSNILNIIYYWIIASLLIVIFVFDLKHFIIPDKVIFPAIAIALIFSSQFLFSADYDFFKNLLLSAFAAAGFFLFLVLITKGKGMGIGDIKLGFLIGIMLGFPDVLVALFSAFLLGSIIGLLLIFLNKKTFKSEIPFGPFLVAGIFLALFWGKELINWYQTLFLI